MSLARLRHCRSWVFLTGAGISAESGIPTFRGEEGYWVIGSRNYQPQEMATQEAFERSPREVWAWYLFRRAVCRAAQPNPGHLHLLELERRLGPRFLLVTQNIDGLHLRVGHSPQQMYEVHGNLDFARCGKACGQGPWPLGPGWEPWPKDRRLNDEEWQQLSCPQCGQGARPHVLWFDECYDEELYRYHSSRQAALQADALISVGTSGATNLPLQMGRSVAGRGALLIDINPESNVFSQLALSSGGLWLQASATQGLAQVLQALQD